MSKQIIICILVIIIVIWLDAFTARYTNNIMDNIISNLSEVREAIYQEDEEKMIAMQKKILNALKIER